MIYHIASAQQCLDLNTLKVRAFAAIWHIDGEKRVVDAWRFADSQDAAIRWVQTEVPSLGYQSEMRQDADEVYQQVRQEQASKDWGIRFTLPKSSALRLAVSSQKRGWHVLRSAASYPCIAAAAAVGFLGVSVRHVRICEEATDLDQFMDAVVRADRMELLAGVVVYPQLCDWLLAMRSL